MSEFTDAIDSAAEPDGGYRDVHELDFHERSFADMIERLFQQFDDRLPLPTIVQVVRESRDQLRGSPAGAMPELTERLAIARLTALSEPELDDVAELVELDVELDAIAPVELLSAAPTEAVLTEPALVEPADAGSVEPLGPVPIAGRPAVPVAVPVATAPVVAPTPLRRLPA